MPAPDRQEKTLERRLQNVISPDGTTISFELAGDGPPLVLVHGTAGARGRWGAALRTLSDRFTLYLVDRRGRGDSGDSRHYSIEKEFEDVAAVVDALDRPVSLLGHSFGAICALEAALMTDNLGKLILYEPPIAAPNTDAERRQNARLERMLADGDRERVVITFLREIAGLPDAAIERMRSAPSWPARVEAAHTLPREHRGVTEYELRPERFANFDVPTLLLLGGDSPSLYSDSVRMVDAALPASNIVILPGQQHVARDTAPELFVSEVVRFLGE